MTKDEASAPEGLHPIFADLLRSISDPNALERALEPQPVMTMVQQRKLFALQAAYNKAMLDANVRLPSYLHAAIDALK